MGAKWNKFIGWVDAKKGRMKKVVISFLLFVLLIGIIIIGVIFILTFGYNEEEGLHKDPAKVEIDIDVKRKGAE
jgi:heme/copper-type cytochrome/quinol oxidase subunit 2